MNWFRQSLVVFFALVASFAFLACGQISFDSALFSNDAWIAREGDSYSYIRHTQTVGEAEVKIGFTGFYGKQSLWALKSVGAADLGLNIDIAAGLRGHYKVCLVEALGRVTVLASARGSSSHTLALSPGTHYIVVVGDAAYGNVTLRLLEGPEPRPYEVRLLL